MAKGTTIVMSVPEILGSCKLVGADPEWGEAGCAYVVPCTPELDTAELRRWAGERLARYKLPRDVVLVDALPRTPSGKVQKHLL